jgi:hypothetical protein
MLQVSAAYIHSTPLATNSCLYCRLRVRRISSGGKRPSKLVLKHLLRATALPILKATRRIERKRGEGLRCGSALDVHSIHACIHYLSIHACIHPVHWAQIVLLPSFCVWLHRAVSLTHLHSPPLHPSSLQGGLSDSPPLPTPPPLIITGRSL